jgi:RND family efflux transporter MFP subunit
VVAVPPHERRSIAGLARGLVRVGLGVGLSLGWAVGLGVWGCGEAETTRLEETPPPHVRVATVVEVAPQPQSRHLVLLVPARRARLAPRLGGQVVELRVDEQEEVKTGQVLARLASDDPKGALMAAQATIARIKESMHDSARELDTAETLVKQGAETSRTVERLQTEQATLDAQLSEAKGQLVRAKDAMGATTIEAPFDGTITRIDTEIGEYVGPQSVAMELAQLDPLAAEVPLSETELRLHDEGGLEFALLVRGEVRPARLEWLAREADPGTSTFTARLLLDNPDGRLRAGESAEVQVRGPHAAPAKAVPMTAVRWSSDRAYVLVLSGDKVDRVPVRVLEDSGDLVAIDGELKVGDRVVATGPTALMPGETVVAVEGSAPEVASR